jgi:serine/threonine protein kinase
VTDIPPQLAEALRDQYRLERELGRGGMGAVYLAEDLKQRRKVAIKVLRPDLAAALGTDRFLREIELAAQLQHPAILPLHDSGHAGPTRNWHRFGFAAHGGRFYFTVGDRQSDVWAAEVEPAK